MAFWWSPSALLGAIGTPAVPVVAPTLAEGTTAAALKAGSVSIKYTVAIEGYDKILTDATRQQAIDAWYAEVDVQHYEDALEGLYITCDYQQQLDWRNPFPRGGALFMHIAPDTDDTFGIATHKADADDETDLDLTSAQQTSDVTVKSTTGFATSGEANCGTECFEYDSVTSTTLHATKRGKYAALHRETGECWAEYHRVGEGPLEVLVPPRVTSTPTMWIGKWVSVYVHKYDPSIPALNAKGDALRVFAGRIESITDDPATGCTVVEVKHVLDHISEATVGGRDQWKGQIQNLIQLREDMEFEFSDTIVATTPNTETAGNLTVVTGATGTDEVEPGYYTHAEIYGILNTWLTGDASIQGTYNFGTFVDGNQYRSDIYWTINGTSSGDMIGFELRMPELIAGRLGFNGTDGYLNGLLMTKVTSGLREGGKYHGRLSEEPLYRFTRGAGGVEPANTTDNEGVIVDQTTAMPGSTQPLSANSVDSWGIFLIDESFLAYGYTSGASPNLVINDLEILPEQFGLGQSFPDNSWRLPWRVDGPDYTPIRQLYVLEFPLSNALCHIFKSTGSPGYNDAVWDTLAYGIGLSIPWEICDGDFDTSANALPHSDKPITLLIDKPIKLSTLLAGELIVRRAFLRWNNETGKLEFSTWKSPTESNSVDSDGNTRVLDEANKAAPAGNLDHHRSVTTKVGGWAVPIVNLRYNRSLASSPGGDENFRDTLTIVDYGALGALGGDGPTTNIDLRGTFGDFASTGQTADSLAATFMATMPYFSNPARLVSRSIDQTRYLLSIGDVVRLDDAYARDPSTGRRAVSRYGIIIRHRFNLGGLTPNAEKPADQGGDVDVFTLDVNRVASYVPSSQVDESQANAGYNAGTGALTVYAHKYSETTEPVDATRFVAGDKIRIIEIDPADPTTPLSWDRVIDTVVGNVITPTATLSSPAWDATKKYRIIFDDYTDAVTLQRAKTFQADDADAKIQDLRVPYEYGVGGAAGDFTYWTASDPVELPPDAASGDGVGRDVGHEVALVRLLNTLTEYKTAVSSPCLNNAVFDPTAVSFGGGTWWLVQCGPVFLGAETMNGIVYRKVAVAPHFASLSGGTANVRVTLSRTPPTGPDLIDVDRGSIYASTTFTTTSTTFATPTPVEIDARVKGSDGVAWVYVEINSSCTCWGLSHLQVSNVKFLGTVINV